MTHILLDAMIQKQQKTLENKAVFKDGTKNLQNESFLNILGFLKKATATKTDGSAEPMLMEHVVENAEEHVQNKKNIKDKEPLKNAPIKDVNPLFLGIEKEKTSDFYKVAPELEKQGSLVEKNAIKEHVHQKIVFEQDKTDLLENKKNVVQDGSKDFFIKNDEEKKIKNGLNEHNEKYTDLDVKDSSYAKTASDVRYAEQDMSKPIVNSVQKAVLEAVVDKDQPLPKHLVLHLDPPELGSVDIKIRMHAGHVYVDVKTESSFVAEQLKNHMSDLPQHFKQEGISLGEMSVSEHGNKRESSSHGFFKDSLEETYEEKKHIPKKHYFLKSSLNKINVVA